MKRGWVHDKTGKLLPLLGASFTTFKSSWPLINCLFISETCTAPTIQFHEIRIVWPSLWDWDGRRNHLKYRPPYLLSDYDAPRNPRLSVITLMSWYYSYYRPRKEWAWLLKSNPLSSRGHQTWPGLGGLVSSSTVCNHQNHELVSFSIDHQMYFNEIKLIQLQSMIFTLKFFAIRISGMLITRRAISETFVSTFTLRLLS